MMNIRKNKTIVCIITTLLIIAGSFLIGTPAGKVEASETTAISEKILSVKCQLSEDKTKLRMVTTIDEQLQYKNVGFEVTFLGDDDAPAKTKTNTAKYVYRRINATDATVKYEFGPKAFNAASEWIATYTITKIPEAYLDNGIIIKPYVTMKDTLQKVYGEHRYLTMLDQDNGVVSLPVKGILAEPKVAGATVKETYFDGTYTHVRVGADYASLPSISTYTVTDNGTEYTEKYRYLHSTVSSDQSWYNNSDADDKVIVTAGDMQGFQELSKTNNFATDTIYLGADITFNEGKDLSVANTSAEAWTPIGYSGMDETAQQFAGIFDGDMHSISGIYISQAKTRLGLFGLTAAGCEIKNLELKNSYIRSTNAYYSINRTGAIVGDLNGTLDTIKCDTDVTVVGKGKCTGGLAGTVVDGVIKNSWFAGSVKYASTTDTNELGQQRDRGGIVGGLYATGSYCEIQSCLVTGQIDNGSKVGGILGNVYSGSEAKITDSLFAGSFATISGASTTYMGTVFGEVKGTGTATNVYVQDLEADYLVENVFGNPATSETTEGTGVTTLTDSKLVSSEAYAHMYLDFYEQDKNSTGTWFALEDSYPILTSFADTSNPVEVTVDTYWFDSENPQSSYTLNSVAEFRGFQKLAARNNFHNIEIILGTDIDLNPGWTVEDGTPDTVWTPIGRLVTNASSIIPFRGTFNGQGHTIKGVYVNSSSDRIGLFATTGQDAVIQNFTLENSAIYGTKESGTGSVGSIVGRLGGTLDTVKSSADVILSGCEYAGGLVGDINSTVGATITNCWFAGNMGGTGSHHGQILGGVRNVSGSDTMNTCTVTHCLATGSIAFKGNTGGLVGTLWGGSTLNISDTLFAGTFLDVTNSGNHGAVVGNAPYAQSVTVNVTNVYVQKGSGIADTKIIGNVGDSTHNESQKANVKYVEVKELYLDDARENTALTIYPQGQDTSSDGNNKQHWWYVSETHPVLASFGTPVTYDKVKVATYNIGSCIKLETNNHEAVRADVVSFIRDNNIDVCLLQEVDQDCARTNSVDQAKAIAEALGYYYAYAPALENTVSSYGRITSYGIAIVSRYPINSTVAEKLAFSGQEEDRAILKAMVDVNGTETAIICTHFDNAEDTTVRTKSVAEVKSMIDGLDASTPVIFGGDLNQAYAGDNTVVVKEVGEFLNSVTKARYDAKTTMAGSTWYQLDYIFTNALVECGRAKVYTPTSTVEGLEGSEISDHRPLVVNLYMNIK